MGGGSTESGTESTEGTNLAGVYADNSKLKSASGTGTSVTENNLTPFKKYLDDTNSDIRKYIGESGIVYSYDAKFNVFAKDANGTTIDTNDNPDPDSATTSSGNGVGMARMSSKLSGTSPASGAKNFEELTPGADGKGVSQVVKDSYDMVYGNWPENSNEVVLVLDKNNSIPTATLYQLGLITKDQYKTQEDQIKNGATVDSLKWDYSELSGHTFQVVPASDYYIDNGDGTFKNVKDDKNYQDQLLDNSYNLKIVGVIRPMKDAKNATLSSAVAYTSALTNYVIDHTNNSAVIQAQEKAPDTNVLNGLNFDAVSDDAKAAQAASYISKMNISDKAAMYTSIMYSQSSKKNTGDNSTNATATGAQAAGTQAATAQAQGAEAQGGMGKAGKAMDETTLAAAMDKWLEKTPDNTILLSIYTQYVSGSTYDNNMTNFGKVSYDKPKSISIYTDSFENKDAVSDCITQYNKTADKDNQITYTDYVALLTSSLTSIVNIISYVLIAFVSVSLVVSCIMIGIITHISVLERTKEIGILRALGASKRNISQVFNAETFIIGICSGIIGVGISMLLTIPINAVINSLLGADTLKATLQPGYAVILIAISMFITVLGGLLPARKAAKKDPVIALRTE
jgi:putative ABC transport system permease protein